MQASELTCAQCGGPYFSGPPSCAVCTDKAHRAYVAALERVAAAARGGRGTMADGWWIVVFGVGFASGAAVATAVWDRLWGNPLRHYVERDHRMHLLAAEFAAARPPVVSDAEEG